MKHIMTFEYFNNKQDKVDFEYKKIEKDIMDKAAKKDKKKKEDEKKEDKK